jgi:hypothetical protein
MPRAYSENWRNPRISREKKKQFEEKLLEGVTTRAPVNTVMSLKFHERRRISWAFQPLLPSQDWFCSMKSVSFSQRELFTRSELGTAIPPLSFTLRSSKTCVDPQLHRIKNRITASATQVQNGISEEEKYTSFRSLALVYTTFISFRLHELSARFIDTSCSLVTATFIQISYLFNQLITNISSLDQIWDPGYFSRYSDRLRAGRPRGRVQVPVMS